MVEAPELETEPALGADIGESLGPEPVLQADKDSVTPGASVEDQSSTRDEESKNVNVRHPGTLELLAQSCREEAREAAKDGEVQITYDNLNGEWGPHDQVLGKTTGECYCHASCD